MMDTNNSPQKQIDSIGNTEIPAIGLGTYQTGGYECFSAVKTALEAGYRHVDTAMAYENEAVVGRAIEHSSVNRDDIFLTTKIKGYPEFVEPDRLLQATNNCLDRLGTDYVDLLLIHWWNSDADMDKTFAAMDKLVDAGKANHIGVSNFSADQLRRAMDAADTPITTNQVEYHPYWGQSELLNFCKENDIILTAYSPLAEGLAVEDNVLSEIGEQYGKTAPQVAIRWLIQQDNVVTIPKSVTDSHLCQNLQVFDFDLSPAEMTRISELDGPFWYRQNREGGHIYNLRGKIGPAVESLLPGPVFEKLV